MKPNKVYNLLNVTMGGEVTVGDCLPKFNPTKEGKSLSNAEISDFYIRKNSKFDVLLTAIDKTKPSGPLSELMKGCKIFNFTKRVTFDIAELRGTPDDGYETQCLEFKICGAEMCNAMTSLINEMLEIYPIMTATII